MTTRLTRTLPILAALTVGAFATGCGAYACDAPPDADLALTLVPQSISAGTLETVVVSFERSVFTEGEFKVQDWEVRVLTDAGGYWLGTYSDSLFSMDFGFDSFVTGVILSGEVINDRSIELAVEFPDDMPADSYPIQMFASNGGVECSAFASGEAMISVRE